MSNYQKTLAEIALRMDIKKAVKKTNILGIAIFPAMENRTPCFRIINWLKKG